MHTLLASLPVRGPNGQRVQVLFYEGGPIRFRIYNAGPMAITEAFLPGVDKHVIIKVQPVDRPGA